MCYGSPAKSLEIARARMTQEQWERFEKDFEHFCAYSGLIVPGPYAGHSGVIDWAKWAYFKGRQESQRSAEYGQYFNAAKELGIKPYTVAEYADRCNAYDRRIESAHFERIAIAMMSDEQAEASLTRWKGREK